jgi:LmbE family N-acetylglucosaminyl deacetylase
VPRIRDVRPLLIAVALAFTVGSAGAARVRAVIPPVRLLWIGAHPDDEALVAPIFGPLCAERSNDCTFIVLTNASPQRAVEFQRSAAALHAHAIQWDLPDVFDVTQWGDRAALVSRLASMIAAEAPTVIYTFDPRHGSSCHPAHREAGQLTLDAVAILGTNAPPVMLVETLILRDASSQIVAFAPATSLASSIDATLNWHYLVDDAAIHESQFSAEQVEILRSIPVAQRRVWLLPAGAPAGQIASCP